jgi:hypothetical protein
MMSDRGIISTTQTDQSVVQYASTEQVRSLISKTRSSLVRSCSDPRYAALPGCIALPSGIQASNGVSRIETLRSIFDTIGIAPISGVSGYADIDGGKIPSPLVGYVTRARDLGCIDSTSRFRPLDAISQGELIKIMACAVQYVVPVSLVDSSWISSIPAKKATSSTLNTPLSNQNNPLSSSNNNAN